MQRKTCSVFELSLTYDTRGRNNWHNVHSLSISKTDISLSDSTWFRRKMTDGAVHDIVRSQSMRDASIDGATLAKCVVIFTDKSRLQKKAIVIILNKLSQQIQDTSQIRSPISFDIENEIRNMKKWQMEKSNRKNLEHIQRNQEQHHPHQVNKKGTSDLKCKTSSDKSNVTGKQQQMHSSTFTKKYFASLRCEIQLQELETHVEAFAN